MTKTILHAHGLRRAAAIACATALCIGAGVAAQEPAPSASDHAQNELVELFGKVETRLREIDKLLSDAAAGDTRALEEVGPAGIDDLLKKSRQSGEAVVQDIDRILEIARQMSQSSGSGGSSGSQPGGQQGQGQSPLQGQSSTTTQRESTPSSPGGKEPGGEKPDGEKPGGKDGQKPKPDAQPQGDGKPKDPLASPEPGSNKPDGPPPGGAKDGASAASDARDRWGDLPTHVRDVFRSEGGRDMPMQYRDWIDAYYRRLNQKQP